MVTSRVGAHTGEAARPDLAGLSLSIQDLLDAIPAGALVVDEQGIMLAVNAEIARQFGYSPSNLLGQSVEMLVPSRLRRDHTAMRSSVNMSDRMRAMGPGRSLEGQRKGGSVFPIEVGLRKVSKGNSKFVLAVVSDRTHQVRAQEMETHAKSLAMELAHQEVLTREMGHRVKNLIATITALISLSARDAQSAKQMEESLRGRVLALSSVIDLAFKMRQVPSPEGTLSIKDILRAVLAPFTWTHLETDRVSLSGPQLVVGQRTSEVLALVFHELMTNAVKYGGLSRVDGRILVDWRQADRMLELRWREKIARFKAPASATEGFGMTLISRVIEAELGGKIERNITKQGWEIRISIPSPSADL